MVNFKCVPTSEYDKVVAAAEKYVEGLLQGKAEIVAEAFHKDAIMYGFTPDGLLGGPIKNLYDFVKTNGSAPDIKTRIDILAITPTTAVVRIDMENDAVGADYNDYLTFLKQGGKWQAIAKVFHMFEK